MQEANPWVQSLAGEDPLEEGWQPTAVFSLVKYHGQRSLVGYKEDRKESDVTEHPATHTHTHRL